MFKDLTETEIVQMLAFSLESFSGDKNSVIGAIQSLNPQFIQVMNLYKQKLATDGTVEINKAFMNSMTKSHIDSMVRNFDRRIRSLNLQVDHEVVSKRANSFAELTLTCISEILEKEGMKFLKDTINQLY